MDKTEYSYKTLEGKYGGFLAPSFKITVGSIAIDSAKAPVSSLTVDIDAGAGAGGCTFSIESQYDYENGKWNNDLLDTIEVGKIIVIEAGYVTKKQIFYGFVDGFGIEYSNERAPRLAVEGIDAKGYLMNARGDKYLGEKTAAAVINEFLGECVSKAYATSVTIGDIQAFGAQLIQENTDPYKSLCFLAQLYGMHFFVVNGEIIFDKVETMGGRILTLNFGLNLLRFSKKMTLRKQVGKVVVYGIDPKTKESISGEASSASVGEGKSATDIALPFSGVTEKVENRFVTTPEECKKLAQSIYDASSGEFVRGAGACVGIPELIPGRYIGLEGLDSRSEGDYFINKVTHNYSIEEGYFTNFEVSGAKTG